MSARNPPKDVVLRVRVGERYYLGPGKIALLRLIGEHGSISAAAREMKMSYRRAWLLVEGMNQSFKAPVVETAAGGRQGGGATLTALGRELVERYTRMEVLCEKALAADLRRLQARSALRDGR
ncbi:MAG: LysR family transcriptional regulator [Pseudomonadota bacterium]|nr:MAG: LysR family transcriptional regulator [Pseudomonadota bacterium]